MTTYRELQQIVLDKISERKESEDGKILLEKLYDGMACKILERGKLETKSAAE